MGQLMTSPVGGGPLVRLCRIDDIRSKESSQEVGQHLLGDEEDQKRAWHTAILHSAPVWQQR